jgi:phosphopantothenoylcysteine decarboxylase/phosphopantothenate--cysteine ligase
MNINLQNNLKNKKILLGITGSIAAYKSPLLVRELIKMGAEVKVVITPSAQHFVTPITLASVSKNNVVSDMFDLSGQNEGAWHIHLAHWCDLAIIAPCSATTLGKFANGIADNALIAVFMAIPKNIPIVIAPAMDTTMFEFPATQNNIQTLQSFGFSILPPDSGELASGLTGPGRLPDVNVITNHIAQVLANGIDIHSVNINQNERLNQLINSPLEPLDQAVEKGKFQAELELEQMKNSLIDNELSKYFKDKKVLITAGPTIERIDPVRYISNFSSGKMGYAIAEVAKKYAKEVLLVSGKVNLNPPDKVKFIEIESADELNQAVQSNYEDYDIIIMAAAVADYKLANPFPQKHKHSENNLQLDLVPTVDILGSLGAKKNENQILIGFALETENAIDNAKLKLKKKNLDLIITNIYDDNNQVFGSDLNEVVLLDKSFNESHIEKSSKSKISIEILKKIANLK